VFSEQRISDGEQTRAGRLLRISCRIFEFASYLFWVNGVAVVVFAVSNGPSLMPFAGTFLTIGAVALLVTKQGLRRSRPWAWVALFVLFMPWTLGGLLLDIRAELWWLVAGEVFGLFVITIALVFAIPAVFGEQTVSDEVIGSAI
jgi:hypothetical protein